MSFPPSPGFQTRQELCPASAGSEVMPQSPLTGDEIMSWLDQRALGNPNAPEAITSPGELRSFLSSLYPASTPQEPIAEVVRETESTITEPTTSTVIETSTDIPESVTLTPAATTTALSFVLEGGEADKPEEYRLEKIQIGAWSVASDRHLQKNEDAYCTDEAQRLIGVFDGMGGHEGSEEASRIAKDVVLGRHWGAGLVASPDQAIEAIRDRLFAAHHEITKHNSLNRADTGTTGTIARFHERPEDNRPYVVVANVADSRFYVLRNRALTCMTLDQYGAHDDHDEEDRWRIQHSLASLNSQEQLEEDVDVRFAFRFRNIVPCALGRTLEKNQIQTVCFEVEAGDIYIATTDGVHDNLTDKEIQDIVSDHSGTDPNNIALALVRAAQGRSRDDQHIRKKADDITAIVVKV